MKVLVTGAKGFVGKHVVYMLKENEYKVFEFDLDTPKEMLEVYIKEADFIIHLAGVNRPLSNEEFYDGNTNFTYKLIELIKKNNKQIPLVFSSSIQATLDNDYGKSKKEAEDYLFSYSKEVGVPVYIYRLENLFGKWGRPNYNSVIATWCYNIARNIPLQVNDPNKQVTFLYIDDVIEEFKAVLRGAKRDYNEPLSIKPTYTKTLQEVKELLESFVTSRTSLVIPTMDGEFSSKLYATYLSYLKPEQFIYDLKMNIDERGSFSEFIRTKNAGQVSVNVAKPGITKGEHYHHSKNEKFLVVYGKAKISYRKVDEEEIISFYVSGDKLQVLDMIPGYTHNITNVGDSDLVTLIWASEPFDPNNPDTYYLQVGDV
ncbi:MAG: SDR family oxidoreductase [Erysipelotrichaceae bacterium]|nr:SDR family oxidoreductase [Erysipelotrichaceae bacterium]